MTQATQTIQDFFAQELPHAEDRWVELSVMLSQEIGAERERRGWTQRELARRAGIQAPHLSRMLSGQHNFTLQTIAKLEAALELPLLEVCRREALSFVERGLAGHPTAAQGRTAKLRAILEDEEHHLAYNRPSGKVQTLEPAGNTSFAMAA